LPVAALYLSAGQVLGHCLLVLTLIAELAIGAVEARGAR
jgi:hypothetical protein